MLPFADDKECYIVVEILKQKYPNLKEDAGFFVKDDGSPADHAWLKTPSGDIIDPTYKQFDPGTPVLLAKKGTPIHKRYYSWDLHHNPHCLHKLLKTSYACEAPGCDYKGTER